MKRKMIPGLALVTLTLTLAFGLAGCRGETQPAPSDGTETLQVAGDELAEMLADDGILLLDVRRPEELEELGTVEGYVNIPIDELEGRLSELPKDKPILTA